jgi:hypothetical protein
MLFILKRFKQFFFNSGMVVQICYESVLELTLGVKNGVIGLYIVINPIH